MKKTIKKSIAVVMSAVLVLTTLLFSGITTMGAVTTYTAGPNVTATFDSSTGVFTLTGTGATYDFRNTNLGGFRQTPWSSVKPNITSVVVGEGITTIGTYCFFSCENLTSVSLPASLTAINGSGLRDSAMNSFGAFRDCTSLESIIFPSGLQSIGALAFRGCTSLKSVTFPDSLTSLGDAAFTGCTSLKTVTFGNGFTEVPLEAFYGCTGLKNINWGSITKVGSWSFYNCGMNSVDLPEQITEISARGFADCYFLMSATINNPTCSIASLAFNNTKLTNTQDFTVYGHTGSTAQTFAADRNYTFVSLDDCAHANTTTSIVVQPTCTQKGRSETYCNDCGNLINSAELNAIGHNYVTLSVSDDTQIDGHVRTYTKCTRCEDEKTNIVHVETDESTTLRKRYVWVDGYYSTSTRGNCQTGAITTYSCDIEGCSAIQIMDAVTSGHTVENWNITAQPTCTEPGSRTGVCTKCSSEVTEEIAPTGHTVSDSPTSIEDLTDVDGHIYKYYTCTKCNESVPVPEHTEWVELCYTPNTIIPPTCTTGGRRRDTCDICGITRDLELPNNGGHDWQETSHDEPTCTAQGQTNYACTKCSLTRKDTTPALGHDLVKPDGGSKLPTCTEDGYNTFECTRCSYSNREVVQALGHVPDEETYSVIAQEDCENDGRAVATCTVCSLEYEITLPALGHDFQNVETPVEDEPGHVMSTPTCTRCNVIKPGSKVHSEWLEGYYTPKTIIEANCVTGATIQDTCDICGQTRTHIDGEGASHELSYLRIVKTTGTITYTCKHCSLITTAQATSVYDMWDNEYYNTVPSGRTAENPSTYLDVNGDNFINAKDFALLRYYYRQSLKPENPEDPENPSEDQGSGQLPEEQGSLATDPEQN